MSETQVAGDPARDGEVGASRPSRRWLITLAGLAVPVLLFAVWVVVSRFGLVPAYLPSLDGVWLVTTQGLADGILATHVVIATQRILIGFIAGAVVGLALGAVLGLSTWGSGFLPPPVAAFRAVLSLAWVPLLVLYVGINEDAKVSLIAIGVLFPVFATVAGSLRYVDPLSVDLGRATGPGRLELLRWLQLWAVVPSIVSGLRLAFAQAWLFLVAAELIASSMGLGFLLIDVDNDLRFDRMFLTITLLVILWMVADALIALLERYLLRRWG